MTALHYLPATDQGWLAMVSGAQVLFLDGGVLQNRRDSLWTLLRSGSSPQDLLDELTTGGISKTPAFALLSVSGALEVSTANISAIARGQVTLLIRNANGEVRISGAGTTTWVEKTVENCAGFEAVVDALRSDLIKQSSPLPLVEGIAIASRVSAGSLAEANAATQDNADAVAELSVIPTIVAPPMAVESPRPPAPATPPAGPPVTIQHAPHVPVDMVSEVTVAELPPEPEVKAPFDESLPQIESGGSGGYDHLFGETIKRTVEDAAVREIEETSTSSDSPLDGDHDGKTSIGLGRAARQEARRVRAEAAKVTLPNAHSLAIELSTGATEQLDQPILIGRAPSVTKVSGASLPRLVTISGPDQDISRNHVQVVVEGGTVVVTDLHSRNGTMIILPGRPPQQLRAGEPTPIIPGTSVDLGSGVTFMVREG